MEPVKKSLQVENCRFCNLKFIETGNVVGSRNVRFWWSRGLRRGSEAESLLGLRVRVPSGHECLTLLSVCVIK
jgi:hypothetical protein